MEHEMENPITGIIRNNRKEEAISQLQRFDMREAVFLREASKNAERFPGLAEDLALFRESDAAVKTEIGKKWGKRLQMDFDASFPASYVYWKTVFPGEKTCPIRRQQRVSAGDGR